MKSNWSSLSSHSVIFPTRVLASVVLDAVVAAVVAIVVVVDIVVEISQKNRSCLNRQNVNTKRKTGASKCQIDFFLFCLTR